MIVRDAEPRDALGIARVHVRTWQGAYGHLLPDELLDALSVAKRHELWVERLAERAGSVVSTLVCVQPEVQPDGERDLAEKVVGFASVGPTRDEDLDPTRCGEIAALYVRPPAWGSGAGRLLLRASLIRLAAAGHELVALWTLKGNVRAEAFYRAAGFEADGAEKAPLKLGVPLPERRWLRPFPPSELGPGLLAPDDGAQP